MKNIVLLGSTGSIGKNVLEVARKYPDKFKIIAIASNENISILAEQAREFRPSVTVVKNADCYKDLVSEVGGISNVTAGEEEMACLAEHPSADIIFIAISGIAALNPLIRAIKQGKTIALASKEPIVSAGRIISALVKKYGAKIIPVDSEHSALNECLYGRNIADVRKFYITGSGGSLRTRKKEELENISLDEVLAHPKWDMGKKITVDSATMMNKGLEVIEAKWLFDIAAEKIDVVIHPEAIIHSMVEFLDGTIQASLFYPDMKFPILKALSYPEIFESSFSRVDFVSIGKMTFHEPDRKMFPALDMAFNALNIGGTMPAVLNSANEASVKLFLEGKIKFNEIIKKIQEVMGKHTVIAEPLLGDIMNAEKWAFREVLENC
ncbi:1-deoxy-D-xylulose 5-phosphate reductoisomerase [Candidatus Omnitrophus magneticus]|uniref:1-deoxy-D-xylulose 5-phosphate reductoisomerase n=1 Tax=Candidatus Omnitrophus magneticus TaxID=1609969 RepID=A0A0F0CSF3_9BACT|nr:1-deoxy-D-xylulose 5-phosphate reductoisomerase [Candidatus Omnitrophus magneticus]